MQITRTPLGAQQYTKIQSMPQAGQGGADQGQDPGQQDAFQKQLVNSLVTSPDLSRRALSMGSGGSLTITPFEGGVKVSKDGPSLAQKALDGGARVLATASQEAVRLMEADPAFAAKKIVEGLQGPVLSGFDKPVQDSVKPFIAPLLRGGMLIADGYKARNTLRNKDSSIAEKVVDVGHVVTDAVGFAGAIGQNWIPFLAPYANTMLGVGFAGDLFAAGFHAMGYITEQGQVNFNVESETLNQIFSSSAARAQSRIAAREAEKQKEAQQQVQGHNLFGA